MSTSDYLRRPAAGWDKNLGSPAPGKWADIVAVSGDPLKDIHNMEKVVCDEEWGGS